MTRRLLLTFVSTVLVALVSGSAVHAKEAPSPEPRLRRFALVIGSNTGGGAGRDTLRYAGRDADKVADVLRQLGGVRTPDLSLLSEPNNRSLDREFDT